MFYKGYYRQSISPKNKENHQHILNHKEQQNIIILKSQDPLFDITKFNVKIDLTTKLFKDSIIDRTALFKEYYQVGKQIGSGSYSSVRLCIDKITLEQYALKIYNKSTFSSSRKKSVIREIRILQMIKHPNIIEIYDVIETNNHVNLLLELIEGKLLTQLKNNINVLKNQLYQIAQAINYLHSLDITHRDIKLENIIYKNGKSKLIDFGFSTLFSNKIKKKIYCGTPSYMAPEIVSKQYVLGSPVDIWAFGILIYYLIVGEYPFKGSKNNELFYQIMKCNIDFEIIDDLYLKDLLIQMLQFNPDDRITSNQLILHPWFKENNKKIIKTSQSKLITPRTLIHPYEQIQSTVKKHQKASIEYQLDQSIIRKAIGHSYMSSVGSTKSPILRRRDSANITFERSSIIK